MRTAIIGAGNMGGSIARGLAKGTIHPRQRTSLFLIPRKANWMPCKAEFPDFADHTRQSGSRYGRRASSYSPSSRG